MSEVSKIPINVVESTPTKCTFDCVAGLLIHADNGCKDCAKEFVDVYVHRLNRSDIPKPKDFKKQLISFCENRILEFPDSSGYSTYYLAQLHFSGKVLEGANGSELVRLIRIGVEQGNPECIMMFGDIKYFVANNYLKKSDPEKSLQSFKEGLRCFRKLSEMGDVRGMMQVAYAYQSGNRGVKIDLEEAIKYFEMAANVKSDDDDDASDAVNAVEKLAEIYGNPKNGSLFDIGKMISYYERAIEMGYQEGWGMELLCKEYLTNSIHQNFARAKFHYKAYVTDDENDTWHIDGLANLFNYIPSDGYYNYYQALNFYYSEPEGKGYKQLRNLIKAILNYDEDDEEERNPSETIEGMWKIISEMDLAKVYSCGKIPQKLMLKIPELQSFSQTTQ